MEAETSLRHAKTLPQHYFPTSYISFRWVVVVHERRRPYETENHVERNDT